MNKKQQELYEKLLKKVNEYCLGAAAEDVIEAIDNLVDSYDVMSSLEYLRNRYTLKKQSTPLQEINAPIWVEYTENSADDKLCYRRYQVNTIETALRALEIIKVKRVNVLELSVIADYETYIAFFKLWSYKEEYDCFKLTQEEFDVLKEILK